jgi:hypothetical protein
VEGWERCAAHDDGSKMIILLVHLVIVVSHREAALDEVTKCGVEVKHACFAIADEPMLDRVPDLARGDVVFLQGEQNLIVHSGRSL